MKRSLWIKALCICYLACFGSLTAIAQSEYPSKPVKIIVPFPPGGTTDLMARISAEQLTKILKQAFVIENIAGGGGVITFRFRYATIIKAQNCYALPRQMIGKYKKRLMTKQRFVAVLWAGTCD